MKSSPAARLLMAGVVCYQKYLSPLKLGPTCRFQPSCSAYTREAIQLHGAVKGACLAAARLAKCGPWHPGGIDPVPLPTPKEP